MTALRRGKPVPEIKVMEETMMVCEDLANLFVKVTLRQKKTGTVLHKVIPHTYPSSLRLEI